MRFAPVSEMIALFLSPCVFKPCLCFPKKAQFCYPFAILRNDLLNNSFSLCVRSTRSFKWFVLPFPLLDPPTFVVFEELPTLVMVGCVLLEQSE